jgi:SAM-dependent methyltransferase
MFTRKVMSGSTSRLTLVDHNESYGRYILEHAIKDLKISTCLDLGCGKGYDLSIIQKHFPHAELFGIDFGEWNFNNLLANNVKPLSINIENTKLPFERNSLDFIVANQVLEHTKEIFWINHEVFRCLKIGGYLYLGVPNIVSFHNRLLMLFGFHPTQHKLTSAHVRPFSKRDVFNFYLELGNGFCKVINFWGSQFYPFPKIIARPLSKLFPGLSFSIFFLIQKTSEYNTAFIEWPVTATLETNFFTGHTSLLQNRLFPA